MRWALVVTLLTVALVGCDEASMAGDTSPLTVLDEYGSMHEGSGLWAVRFTVDGQECLFASLGKGGGGLSCEWEARP